jgi:hypothetical protein
MEDISMKDYCIITCYQFDITDKLINLLGRDRCLLVVDSSKQDYNKFNDIYGDLIISHGNFAYYSLAEAQGRIRMLYNLECKLGSDFDWIHIISQNCLPTAGFYNRENILDNTCEYIHIHNSGWMSNYFTITQNLVHYLNTKYNEVSNNILNLDPKSGALSENIWNKYVYNIPNRVNTDLRFYVYPQDTYYGLKGTKYGRSTKPTSPMDLIDTPATRNALLNKYDNLFARKFVFNSDIYNWAYSQALNKYGIS